MIKIFVDRVFVGSVRVVAIEPERGEKIMVHGNDYNDINQLTQELDNIFGCFDLVKVYEPTRPSDADLNLARAITELASYLGRGDAKIAMIKTFRQVTGDGLKTSKDAIEYALMYPISSESR